MVKLLCTTFLVLGFAGSAQAGVLVSFAGDYASSGDADLSNNDPRTPLEVAVNIGLDGTPSIGSISTASANGDTYATGFSVSGTATSGFGSTVILSLEGEDDGGLKDIRGRSTGGIGMRNGNSGRIDNGTGAANERINVQFDATDAILTGLNVRLETIGIFDANSQGADVPDLGVKDFDGSDILFTDVTTVSGTPSFYPIANGALLAGGSTGTIAIGQPDPAASGDAGFRLNAIGFDITTIPEPSSLLLLALAIPVMVLGRKTA